MADLRKDREQLEYERARRGAPGQAFQRAKPSFRSGKTGGTEENRRRKQEFDKLLAPLGGFATGLSDKRPSLTDFDREFSNALDKKLEADPGQVTDEFLRTMYSNYRQKIKEGTATQEGYNRLQNVIFKYVDITPPSMEGMGPKITPKYLGTKKGGRIKKRKNRTKKNYAKGGSVRPANY